MRKKKKEKGEIKGIHPVCCRCGTMDPEGYAKTESGDVAFWFIPGKDGNIIQPTVDKIGNISAGFNAILEKDFVWTGDYDIVCSNCAVDMFDAMMKEDEDDESNEIK